MEKSARSYNMEPKEQKAFLDAETDKGWVARLQPYWQRVGRQWMDTRLAELAGTPHEVYPFKIACTEAVMLPGLPPQTSKNGDTSPGKKTWMASLLNRYIFLT